MQSKTPPGRRSSVFTVNLEHIQRNIFQIIKCFYFQLLKCICLLVYGSLLFLLTLKIIQRKFWTLHYSLLRIYKTEKNIFKPGKEKHVHGH